MSGLRQGFAKQSVVVVAICSLLMAGSHDALAFQTTSPAAPQAFEQSPEQLQRLVAPIALYPDSLIAQILAAATYPNEIVEAQQWMQQHNDWHGEKLAREVDKQAWDPSVKALTQVSGCPRQYESEPGLDFGARRCLYKSGAGVEPGDSNHAPKGTTGGQPELYASAECGYAGQFDCH